MWRVLSLVMQHLVFVPGTGTQPGWLNSTLAWSWKHWLKNSCFPWASRGHYFKVVRGKIVSPPHLFCLGEVLFIVLVGDFFFFFICTFGIFWCSLKISCFYMVHSPVPMVSVGFCRSLLTRVITVPFIEYLLGAGLCAPHSAHMIFNSRFSSRVVKITYVF